MSVEDSYEWLDYRTRQRFWDVVEGPMVVHLVLALSVFIVLTPLLWEVLTSLKTNEAVYNLSVIPQDPTLGSFSGGGT